MSTEPTTPPDVRRARIAFAVIGGVVTALAIGMAFVFGAAWSVLSDEPEARVPARPVASAPPPPPALDLLDAPLSRGTTATRLVESIDPLRQFERVRASRSRMSVAVNQDQQSWWSGRTIATQRRETVGYLVGRPPRREATSLLVPRCALSNVERQHPQASSFANAALLVDFDSAAVVLRFAPSPTLLGTNATLIPLANGQTAPEYVSPAHHERFVTTLSPLGRQLAISSGIGVPAIDARLAILSLPSPDSGLATLGASRFLRMVDPGAVIRAAFDIAAAESPTIETRLAAALDQACASSALPSDASLLDMLLMIATSFHLAKAIDPGLEADIGPALARQLHLVVDLAREHTGEIVRTVIERIEATDVVDVRFEQTLLIVELRPARATSISRVAVTGITNAGLSDDDARSVVASVRGFLATGTVSAAIGSYEGDPDDGACLAPHVCRGTFIARDAHIDLAAELLERGLVRAQIDDARLVHAQPSLMTAATHGLDNKRAGPVTADEGYRRQVQGLVMAGDAGR